MKRNCSSSPSPSNTEIAHLASSPVAKDTKPCPADLLGGIPNMILTETGLKLKEKNSGECWTSLSMQDWTHVAYGVSLRQRTGRNSIQRFPESHGKL